jgi:hypothetical protein
VKSTNWLAVAGVLVAVLFPVGSLVFAAGQYPSRVEFDLAKDRGEQRLEDVRSDLAAVQREQVKLRVEMESMGASQARVELQLGRLEQALRGPRGNR